MDAEGRDKDVSFAQKKDNEEVSLTNFECALIVMIANQKWLRVYEVYRCT